MSEPTIKTLFQGPLRPLYCGACGEEVDSGFVLSDDTVRHEKCYDGPRPDFQINV